MVPFISSQFSSAFSLCTQMKTGLKMKGATYREEGMIWICYYRGAHIICLVILLHRYDNDMRSGRINAEGKRDKRIKMDKPCAAVVHMRSASSHSLRSSSCMHDTTQGPGCLHEVWKLFANFLERGINFKNRSLMTKSGVLEWVVQPADIGWPTGNGKKLSNSQACCLAQLCLAAA